MTLLRRVPECAALTFVLVVSGCSGDTGDGVAHTTGGVKATGGVPSTGGVPTTGGISSTGGVVAATGGVKATGGVLGTGGSAGAAGNAGTSSSGSSGAAGTGGTAGASAGGTAGTAGAAGNASGAGAGGAAGNAGASAGGTAGAAGTAGAGGASAGAGGKGNPPGCDVTWGGAATRPQLSDASAECFTIPKYFAQTGTLGALTTDNWDPTAGLPAASTFTPTYTVAADGSGTHTTIQAAITAANATTDGMRKYILVKPGPTPYRELVCVKGTVPITLYGADADASLVTIAFDNYNGKAIDTTKTNACAVPSATATTYGTSGSSTFFASSNGFQAMNLTIANDFAEGTTTSNIQAVALTAQGDQQIFQNVRVIGNQDTLQVKTPDGTKVSRIYFKDSYIEGDTDFIFGRATAVFDKCTITYVSPRKTNSTHISPSTEQAHPYGFLIINSKILGDAGMPTGSAATAFLGRAWDDSSATSPNGQAVIRNTEISNHVVAAAPWTVAATSSRAFNADTNRLYEYKNTGTGAAAP